LKGRNLLQHQKKIRGSFFVVSAPSGAGKTTLCRKVVSSLPGLTFSVSYTTRQPRRGEVLDVDYSFISREEFMTMADKSEFIEWAEVHGALYGTSAKRLEALMDAGKDVILDIDTQGAMQIKNRYEAGAYIFILPPSFEVLKKRLEERMTDAKEDIEKRLQKAVSEIRSYLRYDYVIINDVFETALRELEAIILSHRARSQMINPLWVKEVFLKQEEQ
jgi:guanylate kinase